MESLPNDLTVEILKLLLHPAATSWGSIMFRRYQHSRSYRAPSIRNGRSRAIVNAMQYTANTFVVTLPWTAIELNKCLQNPILHYPPLVLINLHEYQWHDSERKFAVSLRLFHQNVNFSKEYHKSDNNIHPIDWQQQFQDQQMLAVRMPCYAI